MPASQYHVLRPGFVYTRGHSVLTTHFGLLIIGRVVGLCGMFYSPTIVFELNVVLRFGVHIVVAAVFTH